MNYDAPMSMILYYTPMTSSTPIHWAIEELKIPYDKVKIDLSAGEQKNPEFLAINPNGQVPALVDGGVPMFESFAMLLHVAETYGVDRGLWPAAGTPARMEALSWTTWSAVTLRSAAVQLMKNTSERFPQELHHAGQADAARKDSA